MFSKCAFENLRNVFVSSVSKDFLLKDPVSGECKNPSSMKNSLLLVIHDYIRLYYCSTYLANVFVHRPEVFPTLIFSHLQTATSKTFIFNPKKVTTDESLRRIKPQEWVKFATRKHFWDFFLISDETASFLMKTNWDTSTNTQDLTAWMQIEFDLWNLWVHHLFWHS